MKMIDFFRTVVQLVWGVTVCDGGRSSGVNRGPASFSPFWVVFGLVYLNNHAFAISQKCQDW